MIFLGYWSIWFLVGLFLHITGKMTFTYGDDKKHISFAAILITSFIIAIPSSLIHLAFFR